MSEVPKQVRCVVIGGGIIGCSVAYHLAKLGLARCHPAGTQAADLGHHLACGRPDRPAALIEHADQDGQVLGQPDGRAGGGDGRVTGFRQNGSLSLALSGERMQELKRQATMGKVFGVEAYMVSASEARDRHPLIDLKGVEGGLFIPANGQADPANITQALAKAARQRGVRIFENTRVTGIRQAEGVSPAWTRRRGRSARSTSSTARGCGRARSAAWRA